jgi:hypothetical protein
MTSWLLIAWICIGPGQCNWEIMSRHASESACLEAGLTLARHAQCVEMTVPVPGAPR